VAIGCIATALILHVVLAAGIARAADAENRGRQKIIINAFWKYQPGDVAEAPAPAIARSPIRRELVSSLPGTDGQVSAGLGLLRRRPEHAGTMALDIERGRADRILPTPWRTGTCIGEWHYRRALYEEHRDKPARRVI
jgi:hypothetical protein